MLAICTSPGHWDNILLKQKAIRINQPRSCASTTVYCESSGTTPVYNDLWLWVLARKARLDGYLIGAHGPPLYYFMRCMEELDQGQAHVYPRWLLEPRCQRSVLEIYWVTPEFYEHEAIQKSTVPVRVWYADLQAPSPFSRFSFAFSFGSPTLLRWRKTVLYAFLIENRSRGK